MRTFFVNSKSVLIVIGIIVIITVLLNSTDPRSEIISNENFNEKTPSLAEKVKSIVRCIDKSFELEKIQDGSFWILKNYIRAEHGELECGDNITYTTHGDYTFLDNLPVLLPRWNAPVSFALYAPGFDFDKTLEAIQYARNCLPKSKLIKYYVTFHIYFDYSHMPKSIPLTETDALEWPYNCSKPSPYENVSRNMMYRQSHNLSYPINVGRNIARKAAITHFILANDVELYPNPGFVEQFLEMIVRNRSLLYGDRPRIFPLVAFEIDQQETIPETKTELQKLLRNKKAIPFHTRVCAICHNVPNMTEWIAANETDQLSVFTVGERKLKFVYWEPFYVSDNQEPLFDERVTWEGQKNKRIQGYAMCLMNYEFHVLNNAFLIHSPGIKVFKRDSSREKHVRLMNAFIKYKIQPEYQTLYGKRKGCIP